MAAFRQQCEDISVISFDLDDTLYDKWTFQEGAYRKICEYLVCEYCIDGDRFYSELCKISRKKFSSYPRLFEECLASVAIDDERVAIECVDVYRSYEPQRLHVYPGVIEVLEGLADCYNLAIITNGYPPTQRRKISALNIELYFASIVYANDLGRDREYRKPHARPYEIVLEQFEVDPAQMLFIGDNPFVDFEGALSLGIRCIRVLTGEYRDVAIDPMLARRVPVVRGMKEIFDGELLHV